MPHRRIEEIKLTKEMILALMQGKDYTLIVNAHDPKEEMEFRFKGPYDGVFLTHRELDNIKYDSEMGVLDIMQRLGKERELNTHYTTSKKVNK